jgi:MinD-like ATPase involved in chromosome partitioning or flagellar assembly/tetratricopeptide (TPR) repeat protein
MTEDRYGQVVTFYSYKGGTGRTMALANVAWILAANGRSVLVVDWDLESPGLHRFFRPFLDDRVLADTKGVVDLVREFEWATTPQPPQRAGWHEQYARVQRHAISLRWEFPYGGTLDFLPAGKQNKDYGATLSSLDWDDFYERQGGGLFFDALRADMKRRYDYTLIDSRTGLSDIADICTIQMPDVLVDCFTLSDQGIEGAAQVARDVDRHRNIRRIRILPVPMRVDPAEKAKADAGLALAMQRFGGFPTDLTEAERDRYWAGIVIPYQAYYGYEETLATFGDVPGARNSLLSAYEGLTGHITEGKVSALVPMDEAIRIAVQDRFLRRPQVVEDECVLTCAPGDRVWAEWIGHLLTSAGIKVIDPGADEPNVASTAASATARELRIISHTNAREQAVMSLPDRVGREPLAIYVSDMQPLPNIAPSNFAVLYDVDEAAAIERVLRLVGRSGSGEASLASGARPRFPGTDPVAFRVPGRNPRFTGRESDLRRLRATLRDGTSRVVLAGPQPVALQGMGGIGKSQLALEYAYRFRSAYDVVWWIDADRVTFIEGPLGDLGPHLGIPPQQSAAENTRAVLRALARGEPYARWLLIYDNAEDQRVREFLPEGHGHTLITSRNAAWGEHALAIEVDVFRRRESIAHLRDRVPSIRPEDANRVAEALGDLPIAIAAAGAWLAETGTSVDDYLRDIDRLGVGALSAEESSRHAVEAIWDLSLSRLREQSPAAYRLLQLCSLLGPDIALELVYSNQLADKLIRYDPALAESLLRGRLVQQLHKLALVRIDQRGEGDDTGPGGQLLVHRLLQHVVRSRMADDERDTALHEIHEVLAAFRPSGEVDDPENLKRFRMLWPHLEVDVTAVATCPEEKVRGLMIDRVRYLWLRADLDAAERRAMRTEQVWEEMLDRVTDPGLKLSLRRQLLHMRFHRANVLRDRGLFQNARDLDEEILAEQRKLLGEYHPHTLMTSGSLAGDLRGLGRYPEALEYDEHTYQMWKLHFGDEYPRTLTALSNVAISFRLMGDFREARERDEFTYHRRRTVLGDSHPNTLVSGGHLGRDLRDAGEYQRSVALLRFVATAVARIVGPTSKDALNAQANLAVSLRSAGAHDEAKRLLEEAYEALNDSLGATSPHTLACRLSRALNRLAEGDFETAERELADVGNAYEQNLGPNHPHTLVCQNNLAMVVRAMNDPHRALRMVRGAASALGEVLSPRHPFVIAARMNVGITTAEAGDPETALDIVREVSELSIAVLGEDHPDTLRCHANQALLLARLHRHDPGFSVTERINRLAQRVGDNHPAVGALREGRLVRRIIDPHPF